MLTVKLICVGKLKEKFYIDAAAEYQKRLKGSCRLEVIEPVSYTHLAVNRRQAGPGYSSGGSG